MLTSSTLATLKAKLPPAVWSPISLAIGLQPAHGQRLDFLKSNGDELLRWDSPAARDQFSVSRWQLRQGLLEGSEEFVRVGRCFERFEDLGEDGVRVFFADGTVEECDLLVGADGWNSKVKRQLVPDAGMKDCNMAIVYFKVPLTRRTRQMCGSDGSSMIFCPHNQTLILGTWTNPLAPYATQYTTHTISASDSYIMLGLSSPTSNFIHQRVPPDQLTPDELKADVLARVQHDPAIHPRYAELVGLACTNTAYVHMVRKCAVIKPFPVQGRVTLLGDAVFNMSNMLGRGANCALADAEALAATIRHFVGEATPPGTGTTNATSASATSSAGIIGVTGESSDSVSRPSFQTRYAELYKGLARYLSDNITRRTRERRRSTMMQRIVASGKTKLKGYVRNAALPFALGRIDGLDRDVHGLEQDWVADEGAWREGGVGVETEVELDGDESVRYGSGNEDKDVRMTDPEEDVWGWEHAWRDSHEGLSSGDVSSEEFTEGFDENSVDNLEGLKISPSLPPLERMRD